jgi:hypothetical protein
MFAQMQPGAGATGITKFRFESGPSVRRIKLIDLLLLVVVRLVEVVVVLRRVFGDISGQLEQIDRFEATPLYN